MDLKPELILPSQNFLKTNTIKFILECYTKGELDQLPPSPIVRRDENGNYIAIDGHNLIAVKLVRNEEIEVHLAADAEDGLPATTDANIARNQDLQNKFESVLQERDQVKSEGIDTFHDLVAQYPELFGS